MKFLDSPFLHQDLFYEMDNDTAAEGLIETKHEHTHKTNKHSPEKTFYSE